MEILIYRLAGLRRQLGRKARTGQSSMCIRKLSPVLSSSLSFRIRAAISWQDRYIWCVSSIESPNVWQYLALLQSLDGGIHTNSPCMGWMGNTYWGIWGRSTQAISSWLSVTNNQSHNREYRLYYSTTYSEGVSASINQRLAKNTYLLWPCSGKEGLCPGLATAHVRSLMT